MDRWNAVASALRESSEFSRPKIDAKRACNRIMLLIDAHRNYDKASAQASGVDEDVNEKILLLDDLLAAYDDAKNADQRRADESRELANHSEAMGSLIRAEAMESMGKRKRKNDEDEGAKVELDFQRERMQKEMEERRIELEERQMEPQLMAEQLRQQQDSLALLMRMMIERN
ncbi:hypothetical protein H310_10868 [Aphanomyces invadans]|uniref:Uncharacterized protein n=1 Tax=Aphanomyces invadans TaxID=157072 RepID=A0A024TP73_9STRA|nr:hypothetical protein H310_10868 [Aphanomyces invadans]ETV95823.1 hypothetical protein H310_10868 [Aphanomyces invadans]|eukprot:XP_008875574.1 hypothetical protein H310_10868 [Aphanomyces invadans]